MGSFKLIAITPLSGCSRKFSKNLKLGIPYQFYKDYKIEQEDYGITKVEKLDSYIPKDLYTLNNNISVNISAIVGKNGTGKSTIIELLYYLIYALSTDKKTDGRKVLKTELSEFQSKLELIERDYFWLNNCIKVKDKLDKKLELEKHDKEVLENDYIEPTIIALQLIKKYHLDFYPKKFENVEELAKQVLKELGENTRTEYLKLIEQEKKDEKLLRNELLVSVLYEIDNVIFELKYEAGKCVLSHFNPEKTILEDEINNINFESFFYSVSVNYSHHSLNSQTLGNWINKLFHKNDAYITPIVINPMRHSGNFDINNELRLSKERLMSNLLFDLVKGENTTLLDKYVIKKFVFTPKHSLKLPAIGYDKDYINSLASSFLFKEVLSINELDDYIPYWGYAIAYLERKISRIDNNYHFLIHQAEDSLFQDKTKELNQFLIEDKSHITKKIRQVVNFLRVTNSHRNFWGDEGENLSIEIDKEKMLKWLKLSTSEPETLSPAELIEYGLPGFFNIDFVLTNETDNDIEFSRLSSGEQQIILNTNSILYHLFNIDSVHSNPSTEEGNGNRVAYKNVNLLLDEVELYFHPEMQRRLVQELLTGFERIKNVDGCGIKNINVCILTHSPFILSDIPSQNVLSLNEDLDAEMSEDIQTFGANIHELLLGKFFMNSTTGEYVNSKIEELLNFYNDVRIQSVESELLKLKAVYLKKRVLFKFLADHIGEDIISGILSNHIYFIEEKLEIETGG